MGGLFLTENYNKLEKFDIKKVFQEKSPNMARKIPNFVYRLISKVLHVKYLNYIIENYGHLEGVDFIQALIKEFNISVDYRGLENIPKDGKFIYTSNHPLGGFDGLLLLNIVTEQKGHSLFLVNDILMNIVPVKKLFVPINKHGNQRKSIHLINEAYASDSQILIFPSGLASRLIDGKIQDLPWNKHCIQKSVETHRDIIPVHVKGRNSRHFYWIAKIRKFFGLKWNIEMFLLADEMVRHKNKKFVITFGKAIPYTTFDKSKSPMKWAAWLRDIVYEIGK
ncbi:1-acyl-sn-glycerol-3-phosphate acyltransferase [Halosquirtibacter laminarini]|uniref:1-acyl-sn-glycerol-3-phosphate acyltransferase n=1 Tax=Halosquirtibacter laminarini TaxID=3374600 RepID=A0AC61NMZ6_9BACT|nr:1-acyl-sn-glycerol-3-phosphate acyltransferase [Prolixibacteraceae bacterium]